MARVSFSRGKRRRSFLHPAPQKIPASENAAFSGSNLRTTTGFAWIRIGAAKQV
jgi:hypothetical protein